MKEEILFRFILAISISGIGAGIYFLISKLSLLQAGKKAGLPADYVPGKPALVYFYSDKCVSCRYLQKPEISKLSADYGDSVQIFDIDTIRNPELASRWGILSLPTTLILDAKGKAKHINHGAVKAVKLRQQLENV